MRTPALSSRTLALDVAIARAIAAAALVCIHPAATRVARGSGPHTGRQLGRATRGWLGCASCARLDRLRTREGRGEIRGRLKDGYQISPKAARDERRDASVSGAATAVTSAGDVRSRRAPPSPVGGVGSCQGHRGLSRQGSSLVTT